MIRLRKFSLTVCVVILFTVLIGGTPITEAATAGTSSPTNQTTKVGTVTATLLNVRSSYSAKATIIGTLKKGSKAYIISSMEGWDKISYNNGTGWVYAKYIANVVNIAPVASSAPSASGAGSAVSSVSAPQNTSVPVILKSSLPSRIIAGFYTGYSAYSGFTPDKIKASMLNVVDYAFAEVGSDLKIAPSDPAIDYTNFTKLNTLKKSYPNLKTMITVGGWDNSSRISDMALTDSTRQAFAQSCVSFIKQYGFDGVDIDWEYPVSGGAAGRPADKTNFTLLMKTLRDQLTAQGQADGRYYYLTFDGGASNGYINNVQLSSLAAYVDYAEDMTYDLHGPWDSYSDLNAPLYTTTDPSPQYKISVDSSIQSWISAGFPANKLVMGVPFYGYKYTVTSPANNGLYQPFTSAVSIGYDSIVKNYLSGSGYSVFSSPVAQVPYLFGNGTFISYDNATSMTAKAQYAASKGLQGTAAWELSYDQSYTLLSAIYNVLH